jgi:hypothetical protein
VSKLKAIIDSGIRSGIDKPQPPRQMPDEAARQAIRPTEKTIDDFSNEDSFYRIVDEDAYIDLVNSGAVRTNFGNKPGSTITDKLASRPTRYPSFSKGSANKTYAEGKPNHYIIETKDPSIKPSTEGRHGKGTTQFPTDSTGVHLESLPGEAVQVYRHIGDGQYRLVYDQGKVTPKATNAETKVAAPLGNISIPIAAAIAAGTMTPQEAEAGMLDLGLRVLRGDSLDQIPAADPVESLVLGLSRQQSMENQGRDFVPTPDEMLESMSTILKPASTDPDVVSYKGLPTGGAYMGTPETALDVDIVSREDFIPVETLDLAAVQAAEDAQESWFVARRIENRTGASRPEMFTVGTEIYFDGPKPANDKLIQKISDYLLENDVPAYTMIVDPSDANSVIGLRVLDIPQLSGNSKKYATMSKDEYKDTVERSYEQFGKLGRNLEKKFGQVKSATPAYFDVNIKSLADTQDYLGQYGKAARDPDALRQEFYGFKPAQERFRQWEGLSVPYYRDSKGTDPTGGNPTGGKESEGLEGLGFNYSFPKALGAGITGLGAMVALPPEEAQAGVIMTLQELAKRALAGDKDAAAELEKYGGPGRILDQFGDPRSMDLSNLDAVPNVPQFALERYDPPRGRPSNLDQLLTPETAERLEGYARRGENLGGRAWYNTLPLRDAFIAELGPKEGAARFERYIDIVAATSPRSRVDTNVRRSSYLYGEDKAGRPIAGLTNPDFPPGYGHLAHLTQDALLNDLEGGRSFRSLDRPKTSSFAENLKGNQQPMTIDTHNFSAITGDNKNKKSPSGTQYKYLEEFEVEIADKLNMSPAQFQASVWIGADTGVADARPFLEVFDDVVARTAKKKGVSKQKALTDFIRGNAPLFGLATLMTAGAILPQRSIASDAGMGVTSAAMPDEVAFKAPREPRRIPEKQPPGIASLAGQLGLGAMSEIGGAIFGGLSGVGEYVRGGGLLGVPSGAPATGESIRNINEGVSGYVGDLYDAGPEAQALGQQIMQGIGETIAPIAEYAMEGDITDEYGINMLPLLTQKLGIPAYERLERLYSMLPEREQEALKSGADALSLRDNLPKTAAPPVQVKGGARVFEPPDSRFN